MEVAVMRYLRKKNVGKSDSPKLYYLRQKPGTCRTLDVDALADAVQKSCALTKGDVKHVIEAIVEELRLNLANGNKVKLDLLGTFHMTFCCPGVEKADDCTVKNITRVNVRFVPDKQMKLVNASHAQTRSPGNVTFALEKPENADGDSSSTGGSTDGGGSSSGGSSSGGDSGSGNIDDNPLG